MARPRARGFVRGGSRRLTQWVGPPDQAFVSVASGGATLVGSIPFEEQTTIVRTRCQVTVALASAAADVSITGALGFGVVSTEAFTAGVASIPEPFSDGDWGGWFVWRSFSYRFEFGTDVAFAFTPWMFEVDSKAMRRVSPNETMVIIAESQAGAYQINVPARVLVKLS